MTHEEWETKKGDVIVKVENITTDKEVIAFMTE
jgi:hypothetical protein